MERLIDANKLKADFIGNRYGTQAIEYVIDQQPTVDVDSLNAKHEDIGYEKGYRDGYAKALTDNTEPVKHGYWIREPNCWYRCSECGSHYPSIADNMNYHYCPDCGAKMTLD
jgi:DNA-directed RNA polymerase subunit RPC12/RpoP